MNVHVRLNKVWARASTGAAPQAPRQLFDMGYGPGALWVQHSLWAERIRRGPAHIGGRSECRAPEWNDDVSWLACAAALLLWGLAGVVLTVTWGCSGQGGARGEGGVGEREGGREGRRAGA